MTYDIFISYRRDGGDATARLIYDRLTDDGYRVAFDLESLRNGEWDDQILEIVRECKDFIVVLNPGALDRCVKWEMDNPVAEGIDENDWMRREIACALKSQKNVIPVMCRNFEFPLTKTLPKDIRTLPRHQAIEARTMKRLDGTIQELESFLKARPIRKILRRLRLWLLNLAIGSLVLAACLVIFDNSQQRETCDDDSNPSTLVTNLDSEIAAGTRKVFSFTNGAYVCEIPMRWCPPGTFLMGSPDTEEGRQDDETQHDVRLTHGFWIGETEVTQEQWLFFMGSNPSSFRVGHTDVSSEQLKQLLHDHPSFIDAEPTDWKRRPVTNVSWSMCRLFCRVINRYNRTSNARFKFRLPTESEWEYACRAGSTNVYSGTGILKDMACFHYDDAITNLAETIDSILKRKESAYPNRLVGKMNSVCLEPHVVARKKQNAWGMYDMHGNVYEWCSDLYAPYSGTAEVDPKGPVWAKGKLSLSLSKLSEDKIAAVAEELGEESKETSKLLTAIWNKYATVTHGYVMRSGAGGFSDDSKSYLRSAYRNSAESTHYASTIGFRLCASKSDLSAISFDGIAINERMAIAKTIVSACLADLSAYQREENNLRWPNQKVALTVFSIADLRERAQAIELSVLTPIKKKCFEKFKMDDWENVLSGIDGNEPIFAAVAIAVCESAMYGCQNLDDLLDDLTDMAENRGFALNRIGNLGKVMSVLDRYRQ